MINLSVLKDASEIVHYNNPNIPLYIQEGKLSLYTNMEALCHWHEDIEFIKVLEGHMTYNVNGKEILLQENDGILINARQMHYGYSKDQTDCKFICILFKTQLICTNVELKNKYILPITEHTNLQEYYLHACNLDESQILQDFHDIFDIYQQKDVGFELLILSKLPLIWLNWYKLLEPYLLNNNKTIDENIDIQKRMVEYIYHHYASKITLQDIASAGNVCRSKCCQIFKTYFNKTPVNFLNTYRLEISMNLLCNPSLNITEIAYSCGFNSASYYTETFLQYKGCTPSDYRLQQNR